MTNLPDLPPLRLNSGEVVIVVRKIEGKIDYRMHLHACARTKTLHQQSILHLHERPAKPRRRRHCCYPRASEPKGCCPP